MRLRNIPGAQDAILESPYVVQEPQIKKGHWGEVFVKKQPLHIEVGMGKGRFLMDLARLHPDINYIGIEMYDSVLLRALQKREELEENGEVYSNLFFMRVDARLLPEIFEKGEVDKIYLNFSDPWPKARHAKRRLTSREFLARTTRFWFRMEKWNLRQIIRNCLNFPWKKWRKPDGIWRLLPLICIIMKRWYREML